MRNSLAVQWLFGAGLWISLLAANCLGQAVESHSSLKVQFPRGLTPGDTVMIVAPAGSLDESRVMLAKQRLEELGFEVLLPETIFRKTGYLAGSDQQRADELNHSFADEKVNAIFPGTGGYGATRIIDLLDYDLIRANPKVLIGFSDITALHVAIHQRTGLVTFHSPNPQWGLGSKEKLAPIADRLFWRAILTSKYPATSFAGTGPRGYSIGVEDSDRDVPEPTVVVPGVAKGRVVGGNLSVVHAMMGTPYEIDTAGKILFLEDVGEAPYRVDRMLQTMKLAGKLDDLAGVVLGSFTRRSSEDTRGEITTMDQVLRSFFAEADYPVLADFPVGHQRNNVTLPVGVLAELQADEKRLILLENPVRK